ncbi:MAG: hypothetical protein ACXVGF_04540 [Blastococcus sp.]
MTGRRLLAALGTTACVAAVIAEAIASGLRSFDRALADYAVEIPKHVPAEWVAAEAEWLIDGEDD